MRLEFPGHRDGTRRVRASSAAECSQLTLQLLAYETAVALGRDVDQPRNLAKSVTVE